MPAFVAYYRVCITRQGQSRLGFDAQRSAVSDFLHGRGELAAEFTEVESGRKNDRPQLAAELDLCRRRPAVLVIAKLDRLACNVASVACLMESGVEFVAVDNPHANKPAALAVHECDKIGARTVAALAAATARKVRLGNLQTVEVAAHKPYGLPRRRCGQSLRRSRPRAYRRCAAAPGGHPRCGYYCDRRR